MGTTESSRSQAKSPSRKKNGISCEWKLNDGDRESRCHRNRTQIDEVKKMTTRPDNEALVEMLQVLKVNSRPDNGKLVEQIKIFPGQWSAGSQAKDPNQSAVERISK